MAESSGKKACGYPLTEVLIRLLAKGADIVNVFEVAEEHTALEEIHGKLQKTHVGVRWMRWGRLGGKVQQQVQVQVPKRKWGSTTVGVFLL